MSITAPFSPDQMLSLRGFQECGYLHPFTCCDHQTMTVAVDGFHCPKCRRMQTWCHEFMANWKWVQPQMEVALKAKAPTAQG